jgi:hypothetical protein
MNRDLLVEVAKENELVVLNTWFDKPVEKLISSRIPGTKDLTQVDTDHLATTDHILCPRRQRHMIKNVETNIERAFPSDHYPMLADIKAKVIKNRKRECNGKSKFEQPSKEEVRIFNQHLRNSWGQTRVERSIEQ